MTQDRLFAAGEGDHWYKRNQAALGKSDKIDWPLFLIGMIDDKSGISSVLELGCSNGFRLAKLQQSHLPEARFVGVDASGEAIASGAGQFPGLELHQGVISDPPLHEPFDLVIVNYVLHWVDRTTLVKSICAIDRLVKNGGYLLLGDFLPDFQQRRRYHHMPEENVYTFKQDYPSIFTSLGIYKELTRFTYNHDNAASYSLQAADSSSRGVCAILHKSLEDYYPEV